jgi:hypothetical protein
MSCLGLFRVCQGGLAASVDFARLRISTVRFVGCKSIQCVQCASFAVFFTFCVLAGRRDRDV